MTKDKMRELLCCHCDTDACRTCQLAGTTDGWCTKYNAMTIPDSKVEQAYIETFGELPVEEVEVDEVPAEDVVNHPNHYTNGGMECIDEMILIFGKEAVADFCICNAWKYRRRAIYKNGEEDIQKSHWYINKYKELMGGTTDECIKDTNI